jgi:hypothetical protein
MKRCPQIGVYLQNPNLRGELYFGLVSAPIMTCE